MLTGDPDIGAPLLMLTGDPDSRVGGVFGMPDGFALIGVIVGFAPTYRGFEQLYPFHPQEYVRPGVQVCGQQSPPSQLHS